MFIFAGIKLTPVNVVTAVTFIWSEMWRMIRNMKEKGMSIKSMARELSIWRNSVRKYLKTEPKKETEQKQEVKT